MDEQDKKMEDVMDSDEVVDETEVPERHEPMMEQRRERPQAPAPRMEEEPHAPLFERDAAERFRSNWLDIQSTFVDDPRDSVAKASALVEDVINDLTQTFSQKRSALENQWNSGDDVSTEDLRLVIKRYRSFFDRLLSLES